MNPPDGSKAVRLVDHVEGQCRAIISYEDQDIGKAMYCGHPTVIRITEYGREVATSWCPYHRSIYIRTDFRRDQPLRPPPKKVFKLDGMRMPWRDPKYMSIIAAGEKYFGCAASKAYALSKSGDIPTIKVSGRPVVVIADIEKIMAEKKAAAASA